MVNILCALDRPCYLLYDLISYHIKSLIFPPLCPGVISNSWGLGFLLSFFFLRPLPSLAENTDKYTPCLPGAMSSI